MKEMTKVLPVFLFFIMFLSCATVPKGLPEKYNLDDELKEVDQITTFRLSGWEEVDNQSIILETSRHRYYLLVLRNPMNGIVPNLMIGISSTVSSITAGSDRIFVNDNGITQYYTIDKIYELKGRDQANKIIEQLRNE